MNKKVNDEMNNNVDQELNGDKHCGIAIALIEDGDGARYEGVVVAVINMIGDAAMVGQVKNVKILENEELVGNLQKIKLQCTRSRATASDYFLGYECLSLLIVRPFFFLGGSVGHGNSRASGLAASNPRITGQRRQYSGGQTL